MSHTYLIDLYDLIDQRIADADRKRQTEDSDGSGFKFQQGQMDILTEVKTFLAEHYNRKLPRRLRGKYSY